MFCDYLHCAVGDLLLLQMFVGFVFGPCLMCNGVVSVLSNPLMYEERASCFTSIPFILLYS